MGLEAGAPCVVGSRETAASPAAQRTALSGLLEDDRRAGLEADREGEMRDSQQQQMSKYHEEEADEVTKEGQLLQVMADVADDCWTEMACENGQGTGHHENDEH